MANQPDPVTQEILRSSLNAAAEEMKLNLIRTSHSTLIYEILDFAVGLFDAEGRTLAQASGLPIFLGNLGASITDAIKTYGLDGIEPGDLLITNDPYTTGTHLGDMSVCSPFRTHTRFTVLGDLFALVAACRTGENASRRSCPSWAPRRPFPTSSGSWITTSGWRGRRSRKSPMENTMQAPFSTTTASTSTRTCLSRSGSPGMK